MAGCQHLGVSAVPTYMSISHPQPAIVGIHELTGSHDINRLSKGHIEGSCWVHCFGDVLSFFLGDVRLFAQFSSGKESI